MYIIRIYLIIVLALAAFFVPQVVFASTAAVPASRAASAPAGTASAPTPGGTIDNVLKIYKTDTARFTSTITTFAQDLFWLLAIIELLWVGIELVLSGADFAEFVAKIVRLIMFLGIYYAILENGYAWLNDIILYFQSAGSAAIGATMGAAPGSGQWGMTPSGVLESGITIVQTLWNSTKWNQPGYDFELIIVGIAVLICLGFITAFMVEALIESYMVMTAGIIFLGFGGSRLTKDFVMKVIIYAISVGARLFFLQLIVALGMSFINNWTATPPTDAPSFADLIGVLITMTVLVKTTPSMIQSLISGSSLSTGATTAGMMKGAVGGAAATAAGLTALGIMGTKAGMAAVNSAQGGSPQAGGTSGGGGAGGGDRGPSNGMMGQAENPAAAGNDNLFSSPGGSTTAGSGGGVPGNALGGSQGPEDAKFGSGTSQSNGAANGGGSSPSGGDQTDTPGGGAGGSQSKGALPFGTKAKIFTSAAGAAVGQAIGRQVAEKMMGKPSSTHGNMFMRAAGSMYEQQLGGSKSGPPAQSKSNSPQEPTSKPKAEWNE